MRKDQTHNGGDPQRRRAYNRFFQQPPPNALTPEFFIDVNTDLGRAAICATRQELFEIQPTDHAKVVLRYPEWMLTRRMFAEPRQTRFDRGWFKLGGHHARRHSGVVNVDNDGKVGFERVANDDVSCSRGRRPRLLKCDPIHAIWKNAFSNVD